MNSKKQHWTLYFITATIVLTISVQLYWNYNNYVDNKQRVKNEIQSSLDIAIDEYYTDLSKSNFFAIVGYDSIFSKGSYIKDFWNEDINSSKSKVSISSIKISSDYSGDIDVSTIPKILDSIFITDTIEFQFNDKKVTPKTSTKHQQEIQKIKFSSDTTKFKKELNLLRLHLIMMR